MNLTFSDRVRFALRGIVARIHAAFCVLFTDRSVIIGERIRFANGRVNVYGGASKMVRGVEARAGAPLLVLSSDPYDPLDTYRSVIG